MLKGWTPHGQMLFHTVLWKGPNERKCPQECRLCLPDMHSRAQPSYGHVLMALQHLHNELKGFTKLSDVDNEGKVDSEGERIWRCCIIFAGDGRGHIVPQKLLHIPAGMDLVAGKCICLS